MSKETEIEANEYDLIDEAYDRVEVLVQILEKKGILGKGEYETKLSKFLDEKAENNKEN